MTQDPFWTYQRVSWVLLHYHDLCAGARPPRNPLLPPPPPPRLRAELDPPEFEIVRILHDIDLGLMRLAASYPDLHRLVAAVYLDPAPSWQRLSVRNRVALIAAANECSTRTVWLALEKAKKAITAFLSGSDDPGVADNCTSVVE